MEVVEWVEEQVEVKEGRAEELEELVVVEEQAESRLCWWAPVVWWA